MVRSLSLTAAKRCTEAKRDVVCVLPEEEEWGSSFAKRGWGTELSASSAMGTDSSQAKGRPCLPLGSTEIDEGMRHGWHLPAFLETDAKENMIIIVILGKRCAHVVIFFIGSKVMDVLKSLVPRALGGGGNLLGLIALASFFRMPSLGRF